MCRLRMPLAFSENGKMQVRTPVLARDIWGYNPLQDDPSDLTVTSAIRRYRPASVILHGVVSQKMEGVGGRGQGWRLRGYSGRGCTWGSNISRVRGKCRGFTGEGCV